MRKNFKVPVPTYIRRYFEKQYFFGFQAPYKIEEDSLIGKQFMSILLDTRHKELMGDQKILHSDFLDVELSDALAMKSPSLRKLSSINYFLDRLFKDALVLWIHAKEDDHIRAYPATKAFLVYFRIEENEYSLDAAYRHYMRYKNAAFNRKKKMIERRPKKTASASNRLV